MNMELRGKSKSKSTKERVKMRALRFWGMYRNTLEKNDR